MLAAGAPCRQPGACGDHGRAAGATARRPEAAAWLARLTAQTAERPVLALPYADPDVASVVRAGLSHDLDTATTLGGDVTASVLGRTGTGGGAHRWTGRPRAPPTAPAVNAIEPSGAGQVLLSDAYTRRSHATSYTPSGVGPLTGTSLTAVVADATAVPDAVDAAEPAGRDGHRRPADAGRDGDDRARAAVRPALAW